MAIVDVIWKCLAQRLYQAQTPYLAYEKKITCKTEDCGQTNQWEKIGAYKHTKGLIYQQSILKMNIAGNL